MALWAVMMIAGVLGFGFFAYHLDKHVEGPERMLGKTSHWSHMPTFVSMVFAIVGAIGFFLTLVFG